MFSLLIQFSARFVVLMLFVDFCVTHSRSCDVRLIVIQPVMHHLQVRCLRRCGIHNSNGLAVAFFVVSVTQRAYLVARCRYVS